MRQAAISWARWAWRQLTSMRVALMLLLALAIVAIPGSLFPQRSQDPAGVAQFMADNPQLGRILDALFMFNVFGSPWFAAVYILLFISLIGCILPRIAAHVRALRTPPAKVPTYLHRFSGYQRAESPLAPAEVIERARQQMRGYRVSVTENSISAERGYLRETGNIIFHVALVAVLLAFGYGQLFTYRGQAIVVEGESFANSVLDYDSFEAGALVGEGELVPFRFTLTEMIAEFSPTGRPLEFAAKVRVSEPGGQTRYATIAPNEPLRSGGTAVYLSGNGYAPRIQVRDSAGELAFAGAVPFLPDDDQYTSGGVIKVPDAAGTQLGFKGQLLPTAAQGDGSLISVHPAPENPVLMLEVWEGDLGLDTGIPQNVYELDTTNMTQVLSENDRPLVLVLTPGQSVELPDGRGEVTFVALPRFAALDLRHDPSLPWLLAGAVFATLGLMASLFITGRRIWVRTEAGEGGAIVEIAGLSHREDSLGDELAELLAKVIYE